jgi:hypothetical protein
MSPQCLQVLRSRVNLGAPTTSSRCARLIHARWTTPGCREDQPASCWPVRSSIRDCSRMVGV